MLGAAALHRCWLPATWWQDAHHTALGDFCPRAPCLRSHYISYLRRHFMANVAIAGGLLLTLPQGKHDTDGAGKGDAGVVAGGKKKS